MKNDGYINYKNIQIYDTLRTSFKKSDSFSKARLLAGPDLYTALGVQKKYGDDDDVISQLLQTLYRGLNKRGRIVEDPNAAEDAYYTPWAYEHIYGKNRFGYDHYSHPDAVALPQDYYGYLIQPGDPVKHWGKPIVDNSKLIDDINSMEHTEDFFDVLKEDDKRYVPLIGIGVNRDSIKNTSYDQTGWLARPDKYPQDFSNANIAFEAGKDSGINGPAGEKQMIAMIINAMKNMSHSSNSEARNLADLMANSASKFRATYYNPRSAYLGGYGTLRYRSPDQVMNPSHGFPLSGWAEEYLHGLDNLYGVSMDDSAFADEEMSSNRPETIYQGLADDFNTKFKGDPDKIAEHGKKIIEGWDKPNGGRYADAHEYIELLNHMYNIGTGGKDAPGPLGKFHNHPVRGGSWKEGVGNRATGTEAFQSLLNGKVTGNKIGDALISSNMPHASKVANNLVKEANDHYEDKKGKLNF